MSKKLIPVLGGGIVAAIVGTLIFGALSYTAFNEWRKAQLIEEAFYSARKTGEEALDRLVLTGPVPPALEGVFTPLTDTEAKEAFKKAKQGTTKDLEAFFAQYIKPNRGLPWVCLFGLIPCFLVLARAQRGVFEEYTGRLVFVMAICGSLGGYFWVLVGNSIYPLGIDLAGGTELIYRLRYDVLLKRIQEEKARLAELEANAGKEDPVSKKTVTEELLDQKRQSVAALETSLSSAPEKATEVVRKRVDPTGTKGIPITRYGEDRIRIQLPKASPEDVERIKRAISTQGRLTFHRVNESAEDKDKVEKSPNKEWGEYALKIIEKRDPYDPDGRKKEEARIVIHKLPEMEGSGITSAYSSRSAKGGYEIILSFDAASAARFEQVTGNLMHKKLAIVLDGVCHLAPTIEAKISDRCQITGNFTKSEADEISGVLTAGSLPAEVALESEFVVGPALGHEQIESGVFATLIASVLVSFFMWLYYRLCGFVTLICLVVNLLVLMGGLGFFKATMTLPGIAGIALTLGMAVDANVLIFERMREEQARGRPIRQVVLMGFDRAASAIIDSNLTTLISGVILYYLGSGPVRGFAVTLTLGVLVTLFSNLWVCRLIIEWLVAREAATSFPMRQLFGATNYDFMGKRKPWMMASAVLVTASVLGFAYQGVLKNDIYDVDFTGGSLVQFNFSRHAEKTDTEVKQIVEQKLKPAFKANLEGTVAKLKELANSGKTGEPLLKEVQTALPDLGHPSLGRPGDLKGQVLLDTAAPLEKIVEDLNRGKLDLVAQSFGEPVGGNGERKYASFTLTSRINNSNAAVEILDRELMRTFKAEVKPAAVELRENAIRVRLREPQNGENPPKRELLAGLYDAEFSRLAGMAEFSSIRPALLALKVSELKEESYGDGKPGGVPYVELAPLPADPALRAQLRQTVEEVPLKQGTRELRSDGPVSRKSSFGEQVSGEAFASAILALVAALGGIFVYMWLRFEFTGAWGFGAIVAVLHDSMIAIGGLVLVNSLDLLPVLIDLNVVAAVLTIIGYSVNDTIVIFDRIREVKAAHPTRALPEIVNEAVNGMLSRTVLTSSLTLLSVLALLIFGGPTIRGLAFTLFVGMIAGIYSTVFVASPLMIWWANRYGIGHAKPAKPKESKEAKEDEAAAAGAQI